MARRRKTWKSDPMSNDHSALLSFGTGRKVFVKSTRGAKALKGAFITDDSGHGNYGREEVYRHVSDPFEISLVSGIRGESELPPTRAVRVISDVVDKYLKVVVKSDYELSNEEKKDEDFVNQQRKANEIKWWVGNIGNPVFNAIDTLRCSTIANERYFRTTCVDLSKISLKKGLENIESDPNLKSMHMWDWGSKQVYHALMNRLLNGKQTDENTFNMGGSREDFTFNKDQWELINQAIDKHFDRFKELSVKGNVKDIISETIDLSISIVHIMSELPVKDVGGDGEGSDTTNSDDDESGGGTGTDGNSDSEQRGIHDSWQTHYDVEIEGTTFNEHIQSAWDEAFKLEESDKVNNGGSIIAKDIDDKRREEVVKMDSFDGDEEDHTVLVRSYPCDPVVLNAHTVNLLNDVERNGVSRRSRYGVPTSDVWKMSRFGDTKVFGKSPAKQGELMILVDVSGSMGHADHEGTTGYDAFQVATAISEVFPMSKTYAFNSSNTQCFIYEIPNGHYLGNSARRSGFEYGGNTDCSALMFMEQMAQGQMQESLAVIISDGSPASPSPMSHRHLHHHTKGVSHRLYDQGLRFVSVLVGGYANQEYYPSDVAVQLDNMSQMQLVGDAIARIGQTF